MKILSTLVWSACDLSPHSIKERIVWIVSNYKPILPMEIMNKSKFLNAAVVFSLLSPFSVWGQTQKMANQELRDYPPFSDTRDFDEAVRGFIAPLPNNGVIKSKDGSRVVWDLTQYDFLARDKQHGDQPVPSTVDPSLWRQAQLLYISGLFEVLPDKVYQVRGADAAVMSIIEGKDGIIVVDPLASVETAEVAINLYYQNRPYKPITTVIYTHSHIDHFAGVKGVVSQEAVDRGDVKIYAPEGFNEAALDENIMAGNAMARRLLYQAGSLLQPGPAGQMSSGLGLTMSSGEATLILPTEFIGKKESEKPILIDGVNFHFIFTPGAEAPSEMMFFLPDFQALCIAEDVNRNMHNLYTLRGAKTRDARGWAKYIDQAIQQFGSQTEVVFGQHGWPAWGNERAMDFMEKQRDLYKYIHDQTLRLANHGYTMLEIGEMIQLPASLDQEWFNRGYYGTLNHNAKAVYNFYLGWFDGNPSTLHALPPVEASKASIEYMGGADAVVKRAYGDYYEGNYRLVAQMLNQVVFADPTHQKARKLLADALEQLGLQCESGIWRNFYLTGAKELREGVRPVPVPNSASPDLIAAMPIDLLLDYFAIQLDGLKADKNPMTLGLQFNDLKESHALKIKNGVLNYSLYDTTTPCEAVVTMNRSDLNNILLGKTTFQQLINSGVIEIDGNRQAVMTFISMLDKFDFWFNIIEP